MAWTPSIVPNEHDQTVYLVVDDFGKLGRCFREADLEQTDLETVITDLIGGQYDDPVRVVAFNTAEKWSQDVSEDIAIEITRRCPEGIDDLASGVREFVEQYAGPPSRQLSLRLV